MGRSIWTYKHTVLGAMGIFFYVGVEVGLASIAVNYFKTQGMSSFKTASFLVSLYWFGALVGCDFAADSVRASARPSRVTPVVTVIEARAMTFPCRTE